MTAILETKDARIANLEKEVQLLEGELERIRDLSASTGFRDNFRMSSPLLDFEFGSKNEYFFKKQVSLINKKKKLLCVESSVFLDQCFIQHKILIF